MPIPASYCFCANAIFFARTGFLCAFRNVCVCSGAGWLNFPQDPERKKISLVLECSAQYTEHIMLLCLWRQINFCIMEHNKAREHLVCQDHAAKNPA